MRNRSRKEQIKTVTKVEKAQIPTQQNQGESNSFMGNMMTGFSMGMGQSIAFNAVNGISNVIFGNKTEPVIDATKKSMEELYKQCLNENNLESERCEYIKKQMNTIT